MLLLLLMLVSSFGAYSLPIQENCIETESSFYECLKKQQSDLIYSDDVEVFKQHKSVFIQCGAKHSDCHLQTTLMTMIDSLIEGNKEIYHRAAYDCTASITWDNEMKCHNKTYNEHGLEMPEYEQLLSEYQCLVRLARKPGGCTDEGIKSLKDLWDMIRNRLFREKLSQFLAYLDINSAKQSLTAIEKAKQIDHCEKSEKEFVRCLQTKDLDTAQNNYTIWRSALYQCGAEKSDCYLQKHLMKMVDTMVDTKIGSTEYDKTFVKCWEKTSEMKSENLECMRAGMDDYGFSRPGSDSNKLYCQAEVERKSGVCSSNSIDNIMEQALVDYKTALSNFAIHALKIDASNVIPEH